MNWYHYIGCFFSGMFLANVVPHYVFGVCGERFPTPFATPPGQGLSSPTVNVVWGLFNMIVGYVLFEVGRVTRADRVSLVVFFVGAAAISIMHGQHFAHKDKE